jgi:hypothetical protein
MLFSGFGAILLGLPYVLHAFGPTEVEVVIWGEVSLSPRVLPRMSPKAWRVVAVFSSSRFLDGESIGTGMLISETYSFQRCPVPEIDPG